MYTLEQRRITKKNANDKRNIKLMLHFKNIRKISVKAYEPSGQIHEKTHNI